MYDKFVDLLNIINQLISTLNGESTYTAAKKYGIAWQEAADDTKQALAAPASITASNIVLLSSSVTVLGTHIKIFGLKSLFAQSLLRYVRSIIQAIS